MFQDAAANFVKSSPAKVDTHLAERGPLLLTSGTEDHTVPLKVTKEVYGLYAKGESDTEFHEFEGRWFITGRWGQGSGTEVERTVRNSALGKVLLDRVEGARQERRWRASRVLADETERWARFCAEEAGVPIDRYRPEKRIVILAGQTGITWHDAAEAPPNWARLPDRSRRRLGKALIRCMNSVESAAGAG